MPGLHTAAAIRWEFDLVHRGAASSASALSLLWLLQRGQSQTISGRETQLSSEAHTGGQQGVTAGLW